VHHPPTHLTLAGFFTKPSVYSFYPVPFFLLGMLLYTYREHVLLHLLPMIALVVLYLLNRHNSVGAVLLYPAFAYGVLWIASLPSLSVLRPKHDYSYGIYLYGFVVQQSLTAVFPAWSNYANVALAMPTAALVAAASWHFVERPCLALVRKGERLRPVQQLATAA
jgi:peptidoglycan/LPS O-acetylase OafA/YrhL